MNYRTEKDFLGEREIPADALYGIQSLRARENFPFHAPFSTDWYKAMGMVKLACFTACQKYYHALDQHPSYRHLQLKRLETVVLNALVAVAGEIAEGKGEEFFIVPAVSGGAGTSINMNINEILANMALLKTGHLPGEYSVIDPIEAANIFQSTNDVVPTALRVAVMRLLRDLESSVNEARNMVELLEVEARHDLRIGYTQLQEAVPSSFGKLFSTYSEALSRDWWRISKCFERIKLVNLGGGAIGSGIGSPRYFIMQVVQELQTLTGLPLGRSENMHDVTSNLDSLVEVHAILKAHAVNLEKMTADLRLLASDISGNPQLRLPSRQLGSTIMPGKVNPVIPEFVISIAHKVYANDSLITGLCAQGMLELNAYLPVIGNALLESLQMLIAAGKSVKDNLLTGLKWDREIALERLMRSPAITTALVPYVGYHRASVMAALMKEKHLTVTECNRELAFLDEGHLADILKPDRLLQMGYTLGDLSGDEKEGTAS